MTPSFTDSEIEKILLLRDQLKEKIGSALQPNDEQALQKYIVEALILC